MKTFVIVGLGNIGSEYCGTRHNIGFEVVDFLALKRSVKFLSERYADTCFYMLKGRKIVLVKPSTYMNLSGKAALYWMQKEKIDISNMLVIADDVALPLGSIRLRKQGGAGGHNGLQNIIDILNTNAFSRLRFGIGSDYPKGMQVEYVLGRWFENQSQTVLEGIEFAAKAVEEFVLSGIDNAMNRCNKQMESR